MAKSSPRCDERKQVHGKRQSIHARAFWGWLGGRIWPLMRRGGYVGMLDSEVHVRMAQKASVRDLGSSAHPADRACPQAMAGAKRLLRSRTAAATTAFRDVTATAVFSHLVALGEQHWFKLTVVFLTGLIVGVSLEWLNRKSGEKRAAELRSLGWKFRSLSESIRLRTASSRWPDSVHDLKPAMLSMFASARKFDLWAPERARIPAAGRDVPLRIFSMRRQASGRRRF